MSGKIKHPRAKALELARDLTAGLRHLCEPDRFVFAGSLRRRKPEVGDVEVVYVPRTEMRPDPGDLLGNPVQTNLVNLELEAMLASGSLVRRPKSNGQFTWGEANKMAIDVASGIGVDFFQATRENFFSLLVCRTGPMEFNTQVCMEAERRGQKWNPYRGFEDRLTGELLFVPWSEKSLFDYFQWDYLEPWERV